MTLLNKKLALAIGSVGCLVAAAPASAVPLNALGNGPANVYVNVLDMGTTGYKPTLGTICNSVGSCNTASGTSVGDAYNLGEDSWGVVRVSSITVGANTWNAGNNNQYLTGMFYNGFDQNVSYDGTRFTALGQPGSMRLDLYLWNSDINLNAFQSLPTNRTGISSYASVAGSFTGTAANLWLSLIFDEFSSSFRCLTGSCSSVSADTQGFLSVAGGNAAGNFDTNGVLNNSRQWSDFYLSGSPGCTINPISGANTCGSWTTSGNLTAMGLRVPEPASMALAGLGLIGLAALRRRKQA